MINVLKIQRQLNELGFDPGPIDGIRGAKTDAAIIAFKKSVGLRPRAYYGPLTHEALFGGAVDELEPFPWLNEARHMLGVHEKRDLSKLSNWFDKSVSWIDPRDIAWCGAFVATCLRKTDPYIELPDNPLGARNWDKWGASVRPQLGSIMVFWRTHPTKSWHGHVAFYWGEDDEAYHVLGGNQSNAVTITRISKHRLLSARLPSGTSVPRNPIITHLTAGGSPISTNEA